MSSDKTVSRPELVVVALVLAGVLALEVELAQAGYLFTRHFWLDEILTHTMVTDASLTHAMNALRSGVETHPPALYLTLRGFIALTGQKDEVGLRLFTVLSAFLGLLGIYRTLRQSFPIDASLAAAVGIWCHPLFQKEAFDARFYMPWLAGIAWYAYFLTRSRDEGGPSVQIGLAVTSIFVCTVHYFGIISLGLVLGGEMMARRARGRPLSPGLLSSCLGFVALAVCLPMLFQQRSAITVSSWQPEADWKVARSLFENIYLAKPLAIGAIVAWVGALVGGTRARTLESEQESNANKQAPLSALLLLPVALVGFSFLVQPALMERYSVPAIAGLAPAIAWLLSRTTAPFILAAALLFLVWGGLQLNEQTAEAHQKDEHTTQLIRLIHEVTDDEPVIFESPREQYVVCRYAPDLVKRSFLLDFEKSQTGFEPQSRIFVRDLARQYDHFYGTPPLMTLDRLRREKHAYLVGAFLSGGDPRATFEGPYPGFVIRYIGLELYELIRRQHDRLFAP
jgi:hypothetical protein